MNFLTPGQNRLRTITHALLPAYQAAGRPKFEHSVLTDLRDTFTTDPVVTSDALTAMPVAYPSISRAYLRWLANKATPTRLNESFPDVRLDQFIYDRPDGDEFIPRYKGGIKWWSTMSCLFGLAEEKPLDRYGCGVLYLVESGILRIEGGGNHRLLAHVLWGEPRIIPEYMYLYDERGQTDLSLNTALLQIESMYPSPLRFRWIRPTSLDETEAVHVFIAESTSADRTIIAAFIKWVVDHQKQWVADKYDLTSIIGLLRCLRELQEIRGRPWWWPLRTRVLTLLGDEPLTIPFMRWYETEYVQAVKEKI